MKAVIQRVDEASVLVDDEFLASISKGLLVLIGIHQNDTERDRDYMIEKILKLRIFSDENNNMNKSLQDVGGELVNIGKDAQRDINNEWSKQNIDETQLSGTHKWVQDVRALFRLFLTLSLLGFSLFIFNSVYNTEVTVLTQLELNELIKYMNYSVFFSAFS